MALVRSTRCPDDPGILGAFGLFWERDLVYFVAHGWRLLCRRGLNPGNLKIADFRRARRIYVLYSEINVYYVGLASSVRRIGGRLQDHTEDNHKASWNRFSWFFLDGSSDDFETDDDGVLRVVQSDESVELGTHVLIRDLEALLQAATQPAGNTIRTRFREADEWNQVAAQTLEIYTFDHLKDCLDPAD